MKSSDISLLVAFGAGIISFVSPCVLPLIPMYLSFISGLSLEEMASEYNKGKVIKKIVLSSVLFVIGFSIIFVALGASSTFIGRFLLSKFSILSKVAGVVIVILGLHLTGIFNLRFLNYEKRLHLDRRPKGIIGPLIIGMAFAFGWTPCVGPVLSAILLYSSSQDTVTQGVLLLSLYSLGLGMPFLIAGVSVNAFLSFIRKMRRQLSIIKVVVGVFMAFMGILVATGSLSLIAEYFARLFPWLVIG